MNNNPTHRLTPESARLIAANRKNTKLIGRPEAHRNMRDAARRRPLVRQQKAR